MKLLSWFLAGSLILVARTIASAIPSKEELPRLAEGLRGIGSEWQDEYALQPDIATSNRNGSSHLTGGDCKVAGPAVVTIHAGPAFGSGSIVSPEGLVITNNHVVRPARGGWIGVKTIAGKQYQGWVIATDPMNDLALVKLETQERLPAISMGSASAIRTGQAVCAIGSPFARPGVLTRGRLTTVRRNGDLQSALVLQPGNSGGPLLNQRGEMIGVNKAIWQSRSGVNSGISFATNIEVAKNFIQRNASGGGDLYGSQPMPRQPEPFRPSYGEPYPVPAFPMDRPPMMERPSRVPYDSHPVPTEPFEFGMRPPQAPPNSSSGSRLGVMIDKVTLEIQNVENGSLAETAGIKAGDRLVALDGMQIEGFNQLQEVLNRRPNSVVITVNRDDQLRNIRVNF